MIVVSILRNDFFEPSANLDKAFGILGFASMIETGFRYPYQGCNKKKRGFNLIHKVSIRLKPEPSSEPGPGRKEGLSY